MALLVAACCGCGTGEYEKRLDERVKQLGEETRRSEAERALYKRGVKGWSEDVFNKDGDLTGKRTKYSDKCLEMFVNGADKTGKYAKKQHVQHEIAGVVYNINLGPAPPPEPDPSPAPIDVDVTTE